MMGRSKTKKKGQNRSTQSNNPDTEGADTTESEPSESLNANMNRPISNQNDVVINIEPVCSSSEVEEMDNDRVGSSQLDIREQCGSNSNKRNAETEPVEIKSENLNSHPDSTTQDSRVTQWLLQLNCNQGSAMASNPVETSKPVETPVTSSADSTPGPGDDGDSLLLTKPHKSTPLPPEQHCQVERVKLNQVGPDQCPHMVKSVSSSGIRKAFKSDIKPYCGARPCIVNSPAGDELSCRSNLNYNWFCLQCGFIGCGDRNAQDGDAMNHYKAPRSDLHSIVVVLGEDYKCWCFVCQSELNSRNGFLKEHVLLIKRNSKTRLSLQQISNASNKASSVPIALGPPPPPPPTNAPKTNFQNNKQNNRNKISPSHSSQYDSHLDWPLGLENLGNTCFMNSALQCLSRTKILIPKLELYGSGNTIEILVSAEEPSVTILNSIEALESNKSVPTSSAYDISSYLDIENGIDAVADETESSETEIGEGKLSSSPSDLDCMSDVAGGREISESNSKFSKEIEEEMKKPLRLSLEIPRESMTGRLKHAFKTITRHPGVAQDRDSLHRNVGQVFRPNAIHNSLGKNFRPGQQHDSHELLRTVVDMMKKDQIRAFRLAIMDRYGVKKRDGKNCDPKVAELLKMWDRKLYHKTFVDEIFGGELVTTQTCLQCRSIRRSHEEFLDLSLPIRVTSVNSNHSGKKSYSLFDDDNDIVVNRTVEQCLRAFTEPELLTGSNIVECENCHRINLEKLAAGASLEEVFPSVKQCGNSEDNSNSEENSLSKSKPGGGKGGKQQRQEERKKKRPSRQAKMKARMSQENSNEKSEKPCLESAAGPSDSLPIVEDHFKRESPTKIDDKSSYRVKNSSEDDTKSNKSGSLEDYVVINPIVNPVSCPDSYGNSDAKNSGGKRKYTEMERDFDGDDDEEEDELPALVQIGAKSPTEREAEDEELEPTPGNLSSNLPKGLSESLQNLSLIPNEEMDVENVDEIAIEKSEENEDDDDDLDMPAVDGVGNASDIEEDNGVPPLDLGFTDDGQEKRDILLAVSSGNADEGFSEGENSSEEKNSASISASASSSRNSISESENINGRAVKVKPTPIPVTKCPCSRQQMFSRPPDFLTIHLKRFQMSTRGFTSKVSDHVEFPFILDLSPFCSETMEDLKKPGYKTIYDEDGQVLYALYGIVEHSGSLHWGHYVAYVKVPKNVKSGTEDCSEDIECNEDERIQEKWFYISDSHVSSTSQSSILSRDPYILFYERIRGREKQARLSQMKVNKYEPTYESSWEPGQSHSSHYGPTTAAVSATDTVVAWDVNWEEEPNQDATTNSDFIAQGSSEIASNESNATGGETSKFLSTTASNFPLGGNADFVSSSTDFTVADSSQTNASSEYPQTLFNNYFQPGIKCPNLDNEIDAVSSSTVAVLQNNGDKVDTLELAQAYTKLEEVD